MSDKAAAELIGTAILLFTIQVSVGQNAALAPLAIGGILVAIVFAGGPISGAHFNPAVSFAIALRGGMSVPEMITYWAAQLIGAIVGSLCGGIVTSSYTSVSIGTDATLTQALLAETVFTFILCFVILCVATNPKVESNHYYGLSIGLVIVAGAISVGGISGGAFNPAVALGLSITSGMSKLFYALLVSAANLVGGIVAVGCFRVVLPSEFEAGGTVGETAPLRGYL